LEIKGISDESMNSAINANLGSPPPALPVILI